MTFRKAPFLLCCAAAAFVDQACVEYIPENAAQQPPPPPQTAFAPPAEAGPPPVPPSQPPQAPANTALRTLMAPIALYPDPLIALILPASTAPSDLSAAAAYLVQYGDMTQVDRQPWDPSVRALAHYPSLLSWMVENMAWTQAVGSAFSSSPGDVMDAVQQLRGEALKAGTLTSGAQQRVVTDEDGEIDILPSQPDSIYIPQYDPQVVYSEDLYYGYGGPFINYGDPFPMGFWLSYSFDWRRHRVWEGDRGDWREHQGWNKPHFDGDHPPAGAKAWGPPGAPRNGGNRQGPPPGRSVPTPRLMPGTPNPPPDHYRRPNPQPSSQPVSRSGAQPANATARTEQVPQPQQGQSSSAVPMQRPRLNSVPSASVPQPGPAPSALPGSRASEPGARSEPERAGTRNPGGATQAIPAVKSPATNSGSGSRAATHPQPSQPAQPPPQPAPQTGNPPQK